MLNLSESEFGNWFKVPCRRYRLERLIADNVNNEHIKSLLEYCTAETGKPFWCTMGGRVTKSDAVVGAKAVQAALRVDQAP